MRRPTLADYGITEKVEELENIVMTATLVVALVCSIIGAWLGYTISEYLNINDLLSIALLLGFANLGFFGIGFLLPKLAYELHPPLKRLKAYQSALQLSIRTQTAYWNSLSGRSFEHEVANVYSRLGYKVEVTPYSNDKGIDIWLTRNDERIAVQCKAHAKPIGPAVARELFGATQHHNITSSVIVSRSGFTKGVYEFVVGKKIQLIGVSDLIAFQEKTIAQDE